MSMRAELAKFLCVGDAQEMGMLKRGKRILVTALFMPVRIAALIALVVMMSGETRA